MSMTSLNAYLKALHHKYIDIEYDVKVSMLRKSMDKSSVANKPSLGLRRAKSTPIHVYNNKYIYLVKKAKVVTRTQMGFNFPFFFFS